MSDDVPPDRSCWVTKERVWFCSDLICDYDDAIIRSLQRRNGHVYVYSVSAVGLLSASLPTYSARNWLVRESTINSLGENCLDSSITLSTSKHLMAGVVRTCDMDLMNTSSGSSSYASAIWMIRLGRNVFSVR